MDLSGEPDLAPLDAAHDAHIEVANGIVTLTDAHGHATVGYDEAADIMVGRDVRQSGMRGFDPKPGSVCVGGADPVYVALNLAWQRGATAVSVSGLDTAAQDILAVWLADVSGLLTVTFN